MKFCKKCGCETLRANTVEQRCIPCSRAYDKKRNQTAKRKERYAARRAKLGLVRRTKIKKVFIKQTQEQKALIARAKARIMRGQVTDPTRPAPALCENPGCDRKVSAEDHDHGTGWFRGWLCHQCNSALGLLKDSPAMIQGLLAYLERS